MNGLEVKTHLLERLTQILPPFTVCPFLCLDRGTIIRAVAVVINARMKKRGMRWKRDNATSVVALRVQRINFEWDVRRCLAPDSWWHHSKKFH